MSILGKLAGIGFAGAVGAGAVAGGVLGSYSGAPEANNIAQGAMIGAGVGAGVAVATPFAVKGAGSLIDPIGGAMLKAPDVIGGAMINTASAVGKGTTFAGANLINGMPGSSMGSTLASPVRRHVGAVGSFAESMIKFDRPTNTLNASKEIGLDGKKRRIGGVSLHTPVSGAKRGWNLPGEFGAGGLNKANAKLAAKKGAGAIRGTFINGTTVAGASVAAIGAMGAYNEYKNARTGVMDNYITTATPRVPMYEQNAGATGDLVFAMNKLRN